MENVQDYAESAAQNILVVQAERECQDRYSSEVATMKA